MGGRTMGGGESREAVVHRAIHSIRRLAQRGGDLTPDSVSRVLTREEVGCMRSHTDAE